MPDLTAEEKIVILRKALADFVGVESKEELERMEVVMRSVPGIESDKILAVNAIHALLETL